MNENFKKAPMKHAEEYLKENTPGFVDFDDTEYNPKGINQEKHYLNTESVIPLYFKVPFSGSVTINYADTHISLPESQYKKSNKTLSFLRDYIATFPNYSFNIINNNDHENAGQVRPDERDGFKHNMNVDKAHETSGAIINSFANYIYGNAQANHETWFQNLVGTNPVLWNFIPKHLYSRGAILLNMTFDNGITERTMIVHKHNQQAIERAKEYGCNVLLTADDHRPKIIKERYQWLNRLTNTYEVKTLNVLTAASFLPTSTYGVEKSLKPCSTTNWVIETYYKEDKVLRSFVDVDALESIAKSLKPHQIAKLKKFIYSYYSDVTDRIKRINESALLLSEKVVLFKSEKIKIYNDIKYLEKQYKSAKVKKKENNAKLLHKKYKIIKNPCPHDEKVC